jgi:Ca-activated chloride channel family protein
MPKPATMHLRNKYVLLLVIVLISLVFCVSAQNPAQPPATPPSQPPVAASGQAANQSSTGAGTSQQPAAGTTQHPPASTVQAPGGQQPAQTSAPPQQATQSQQQPGSQGTQGGQPGSEAGQQPENNDNSVFVFKKEVEEVVLHATVVDDKQRMITNLDRGAFTVLEDGKPQAITSFRHEDIPVAMAIVIDNSGSMREKRQKVNQAALNLVRSSNSQDQVFIVNFNDEYYLDQDFTADINKLKEALEKIEARGGTALYDAVVASADHLKRNARLERKVLFVVTDGEDNASRESLEQAIRRLQEENGPTVYAIGILGEEKARRARRALDTMAERTGGISFFPRTLDEVDAISRAVAHDIRNQYTIGYKPTNPRSTGGYRTVHVDARAHGYNKLVVRTKSGYYAGQQRASNGTQ